MEWIKFDTELKKLPGERRYVLVQLSEDMSVGMPPAVCVGYLRINCDGSVYFVTPGMNRTRLQKVTHYCDCLGENFEAPLWRNPGKN